jgi:hypothetical protein
MINVDIRAFRGLTPAAGGTIASSARIEGLCTDYAV